MLSPYLNMNNLKTLEKIKQRADRFHSKFMIIPQMGSQSGLETLMQFSGWLSLIFLNDNTKPFIILISPPTLPQLKTFAS